jgi:hypothetical protein
MLSTYYLHVNGKKLEWEYLLATIFFVRKQHSVGSHQAVR